MGGEKRTLMIELQGESDKKKQMEEREKKEGKQKTGVTDWLI